MKTKSGAGEGEAGTTRERTYDADPDEEAGSFAELIERAADLEPLRTGVVWPMDHSSLKSAVISREARLIRPVLLGDGQKLRELAREAELDLEGCEIHEVETSLAAAVAAVERVRRGELDALQKGALHTDTLMRPVVAAEGGLATERRVSHVFLMDVPSYPERLFITDAAINIAPDLETKRDIAQNAIDLAHALGIERPRVAVLSAVETVSSRLRSTVEAAALCKMCERGQLTGASIDGPLAFDTAISPRAAERKGLDSPVAGRAQILLVPDLEAGNMLYKQLEYLGGARVAGIVMGARVPIALTSRADGVRARVASCALAALVDDHRKQQAHEPSA